jgi:hypothetical protein
MMPLPLPNCHLPLLLLPLIHHLPLPLPNCHLPLPLLPLIHHLLPLMQRKTRRPALRTY